MAQNDDQNRDRQNQGEGYQDVNSDRMREGRTGSSDDRDSMDNQTSRSNQDLGSNIDDMDEMEDEDRDSDDRTDGGTNRRRNIS